GGAEPFLQICLDVMQRGRLALLDRIELRIRQADGTAGRIHRLLVGGAGPGRRLARARQTKRARGGDYSATRDRAERCCHAWLFLAAGNITSATTYSTAAQSRTRLKPASRAIRLASGVATTEN